MPGFIDMTGKVVNGFTCMKELGRGKVYVKCAECGKEFEAWKDSWKNSTVTCRNSNCKRHRKTRFSDMTGKEINGFLCLRELGKGRVYVKCAKCGKEFEVVKYDWKKSRVACKNPNCKRYSYSSSNMTGKEINGFLCLRELGNSRVFVRCMKCGKEFEAFKHSWKSSTVICRNLDCEKHISTRKLLDMTDKKVNGFLCLKELGSGKVRIKCSNCNKEFEASKKFWKKSMIACPNCGVRRSKFRIIEGHTICNIIVINFAYLGRDSVPYYFCKNAKTGKRIEFPLSYNELFTFGV